MRIGILGAGAWGTALAQHAAGAGARTATGVRLWARDSRLLNDIATRRVNQRYLPGVALSEGVVTEPDLARLLDWMADDGDRLLVVATSLAGLRPMLEKLQVVMVAQGTGGAASSGPDSGFSPDRAAWPVPILWLCKGIERDSGLLPHQIARDVLGAEVAGGPLFGPSFAQEVAQGLPAALTVASSNQRLVDLALAAFHHGSVRLYATDDVSGVELGGALKNVMAIATGLCDGLALGQNARAALITRGLAEISRLGAAIGARQETFMGLTGLGDLVLTCTGDLSRNRRVGLQLAAGQTLSQVLDGLGHVAEGVASVHAAQALGRRHRVDLPIVDAVAAVLEGKVSPARIVQGLLAREPKREAG